MIGKLPQVSRLKDGRLFTVLHDSDGNPMPRILKDDCWIEADIGREMLAESKPLRSEEIWELVARGILTR
jgi:hypothetical protein